MKTSVSTKLVARYHRESLNKLLIALNFQLLKALRQSFVINRHKKKSKVFSLGSLWVGLEHREKELIKK